MQENLIFLSYRRADTAALTLALKLELEDRLRAAQIFVDTKHILGADRWANEIHGALRASKIVIVVIGQSWEGNDCGKRRIDDPDDWVRREVKFALQHKQNMVLPLLVDGAAAPNSEALPPDVSELAALQAVRLETSAWDPGIGLLVETLAEKFNFAEKDTNWRFPKPDPLIAKTIPVPWSELEGLIDKYLPEWAVEFSDDEDRRGYKRIELVRNFEFSSFGRAVAFLNEASAHAARVQHHPRMMNLWRSVRVWLSTWDAGHRVTALDIEFARYLNRVFLGSTKS